MTARPGADRAAGGLSQSAGQRLERHRGGHGDIHPAAQSGRALRRHYRADRKSRTFKTAACSNSSRARTFPPAASWSRIRPPSRKPTRPGAAPSACGRAGKRKRATRGAWQIVVTEIPYQVQKSKLIERIAELLEQKKLPLLDDIRDEIGRRHPHRADAEEPHGRAGNPDGAVVPRRPTSKRAFRST